ncbi:MAG: hypothetical protein GAK38_00635 [Xylophilus sp.]|nr:MAG: hypothetical protein GAK38_00635 [Xylophilus sp.]
MPGAGLDADAIAPGRPAAVGWGAAYVLAGSQLGGQVLHRRLKGLFAPHPLRYLAGTGLAADSGLRWKAFMAGLRSAVATPPAVAAAVAGAVAAFELLLALFAAEGVEVAA